MKCFIASTSSAEVSSGNAAPSSAHVLCASWWVISEYDVTFCKRGYWITCGTVPLERGFSVLPCNICPSSTHNHLVGMHKRKQHGCVGRNLNRWWEPFWRDRGFTVMKYKFSISIVYVPIAVTTAVTRRMNVNNPSIARSRVVCRYRRTNFNWMANTVYEETSLFASKL